MFLPLGRVEAAFVGAMLYHWAPLCHLRWVVWFRDSMAVGGVDPSRPLGPLYGRLCHKEHLVRSVPPTSPPILLCWLWQCLLYLLHC